MIALNKEVVLVIDDEFRIRSLLEMFLRKNNFEVISTAYGSEGLHIISQQRIDVVVLDLLLPDMSGLEVCQKIRLGNDMPVIFLSYNQESDMIITCLDYGGDCYIIKPFDPNVLVAKVNALLRRTKVNISSVQSKLESYKILLTDQEKMILCLIGKGYTNKEIAEMLNLKEGTIKVYNNVIFQKLQAKNRTQAVARAKEEQIF